MNFTNDPPAAPPAPPHGTESSSSFSSLSNKSAKTKVSPASIIQIEVVPPSLPASVGASPIPHPESSPSPSPSSLPTKRMSSQPLSPSQGILKRFPASPQRDPSLKSEKSYITSSTATSELGVDPIFSPKGGAISSPLTFVDGDGHHSGKGQSADSTVSAPPITASSSSAASTAQHDQHPFVAGDDDRRHLSMPDQDPFSRPSASTRAAKPALSRGGSLNKVSRSALQRTQSAKSVRIFESPAYRQEGYAVSSIASTSASSKPASQKSTRSVSNVSSLTSQTQTASTSPLTATAPIASSGHHQGSEGHSRSSSSSKPVDIYRNASQGEPAPKNALIGFAGTHSSSGTAASIQAAADAFPHPPPPSPASPTTSIPSSVVLPRQPHPSPSDDRFAVHSTARRPVSPPHGTTSVKQMLPSVPENQANAPASGFAERVQVQTKSLQKSVITLHTTQPAPTPIMPTDTGIAAQKRSKKFFLSSPTTDSDDEALGTSSGKYKRSSVIQVKPGPLPPIDPQGKYSSGNASDATFKGQAKDQTGAMASGGDSDDDDDDDLEDGDDSDWSSAASESEEDERQVAVRVEEERQRAMFAKRVPSQANVNGGLLSQLLHPEEYPRDFANLPSHLRNNRSAVELARARPSGTLTGLDRAPDSKNLTVTGMHASKSTAALPNLSRPKLTTAASDNNRLTRLRGAPSGVDLESDDDDEEGKEGEGQAKGEFTPSQHERLVTLMHKRGASTTQKAAPSATIVAPGPLQVQGAAAYTPRTTRRNMLATELTESLRLNLIWERQSRSRLAARGLGGMVAAVGDRLAGRQPPAAPQGPSLAQEQQGQPPQDSQKAMKPRLLQGSSLFQESRLHSDGPLKRSTLPAAGEPAAGLKTHADSSSINDYYSPGFHHV